MLDKKVFRLIADAIADNVGVSLKEGSEWMADVANKTIYYPGNRPLYQSDLGYLIHESAHLRFTNIDKVFYRRAEKILLEAGKNPHQFHELINALEDIRVNKQIVKLYRGAKKYLDLNYELTYDLVSESMYRQKMMNPIAYKKEWADNLLKQYGYSVGFEMELCQADAEIFMWEFVDSKVFDAYDKTIKAIKEIPKIDSTAELCKFTVKKILPHCLPLFDDWDEKDEEKKKEKEKQFQEMLEKLLKEIEKAIKRAGSGKGGGGGKKKQKLERGETPKTPEEEAEERKKGIRVFGGKPTKDPGQVFKVLGGRQDDLSLNALNDFINKTLPATKNSVSILKDLEFERWESGYRSGKIDKTRLRKLFVGSERVFQRKIDLKDDNKDMAIAILVDESGSMNRGICGLAKSACACKAVGVFAKALEQAGRPFAVYGFNDKFFVHKNWKERLSLEKIIRIDHNARRDGAGYNNDGYAVLKVTDELKKRPEKNKVLVVFSDGQPAPSDRVNREGRNYRNYDLKEEAERAEKFAKVYSFGIMSGSVSHYYKRWKIVNDPQELPAEMMQIFKENAGKRNRQ